MARAQASRRARGGAAGTPRRGGPATACGAPRDEDGGQTTIPRRRGRCLGSVTVPERPGGTGPRKAARDKLCARGTVMQRLLALAGEIGGRGSRCQPRQGMARQAHGTAGASAGGGGGAHGVGRRGGQTGKSRPDHQAKQPGLSSAGNTVTSREAQVCTPVARAP